MECLLQIENLFKHVICWDDIQLPLTKYKIQFHFSTV